MVSTFELSAYDRRLEKNNNNNNNNIRNGTLFKLCSVQRCHNLLLENYGLIKTVKTLYSAVPLIHLERSGRSPTKISKNDPIQIEIDFTSYPINVDPDPHRPRSAYLRSENDLCCSNVEYLQVHTF